MKIEDQITSAALAAVKDLYGVEVPEKMIQLQKTRSDFEGKPYTCDLSITENIT